MLNEPVLFPFSQDDEKSCPAWSDATVSVPSFNESFEAEVVHHEPSDGFATTSEASVAPQLGQVAVPENISEYSLALLLADHLDIGLFGQSLMLREDGISRPLDAYTAAAALQSRFPPDVCSRVSLSDCKRAVERLRTLNQVRENEWQVPENLAVFENGVFDVRSGLPARLPETALILSRIHANYSPVNEELPTPSAFFKFLNVCSGGDSEISRRIVEFVGYSLLPANPLKVIFLLADAPDSGKSLLVEFIRSLLDSSVVSSIDPNSFGREFTLASIVGKQANFAMDIPEGKLSKAAVSKLKTLTGRDGFQINPKYRAPFDYTNLATLVFGSNHPLSLQSGEDALWNRLEIVPFQYSVPRNEQDPYLLDKLKYEQDLIVPFCMNALRPVLKNRALSPCTAADTMKASWRGTSLPSVEMFVNAMCILDKGLRVSTSDLFEAYYHYCITEGIEPLSERLFRDNIARSYTLSRDRWRENGRQVRGLCGIGLISKTAEEGA